MKRTLTATAVKAVLLGAVLALLATPALAAEKIAIAFLQNESMSSNEIYPAMRHFKGLLESRTEGYYEVELYPGGQLGSEVETTREVQQGITLQMTISSSGAFSSFYKKYQAMVQPYLFPDKLTAWGFFDSEYMAEFMDGLPDIGLRYLGTMDDGGGFVYLTNSVRPVKTVEDFKDMRVRTEENPAHMAVMNALGASATPMPWGDVITALATNTADAQFNAPLVIADNNLWDVQTYVSPTKHIYNTLTWLGSDKWLQRQSKEHQEQIFRAAREAVLYARAVAEHLSNQAIIEAKKHGMKFNEIAPSEIAKMKKLTQAGYRKWAVNDYGLDGDLLDSVQNEVNRIYKENGQQLMKRYME